MHQRYGGPEVLELREVERPVVSDGEVLVRVRAASLNPFNRYMMTGTPWFGRPSMGLRRPKNTRLGSDFAGTVEEVGGGVAAFRPGDEVFGVANGALSEYVCVPQDGPVAPKPANLTFEQAAAFPIAATTALQGLRDWGRVRAGQTVLVIGASGGVGTFAVQIAKTLGADVTGVCSTRNVEMVRSIGADHVIDYTQQDPLRGDKRYDMIFQLAGTASPSRCRHALTPKGTLVLSSGDGRFTGMGRMAAAGEVLARVVDDVVGAERLRLLHVPRAADRCHLGSEHFGDLDGKRANAARRTVHDHLLPCS